MHDDDMAIEGWLCRERLATLVTPVLDTSAVLQVLFKLVLGEAIVFAMGALVNSRLQKMEF